MSKWICIDFGTCNTAAAIDVDGTPHVVSFGNTQHFPTVACVLNDQNIKVCHEAEALRLSNPETFKQEFKLQIADELDICSLSYADIVTEILTFVKGCAEIENNGNSIENVVLTIPAIYTANDARKTVMLDSAHRAGFREVEFLTEPEAAAMHYAQISGKNSNGLSLIYDLGGGTFDPALLEVSNKQAKLIGHESGVKCGGHFFDRAIYNAIAQSARENGSPLERSQKLEDYAACRLIKEMLSIKPSATQMFSNGQQITFERQRFNEIIKQYIDLTLQACDKLISTAGKSWTDISRILLVGGSTAIPLISEMLKKHLVSHNASSVKIIRNTIGDKGEYNHRFATCLGGIAGKILPPPPPPEKPAHLLVGNRKIQLKLGDNKFGRSSDMDFAFDDNCMSRHHFTIAVTRDIDGHLNYTLTSTSQSKATVINNLEALDARYTPITRISIMLMDGFTISAGKTNFIFRKEK